MPRRARTRSGLSRREFLGASLGALGAIGLGAGCDAPLLEGVCTDRFTYRHGEPILVRAALREAATIPFSLARVEAPNRIPAGGFSARVEPMTLFTAGDPSDHFSVAAKLPSAGLPPGVYELSMPASALQPQNVQSNWSGYPADNWRCTFAVTDAIPGSRSKILLLLDTMTGVAYGSFANQSIYGPGGSRYDTVPYVRPGVGRGVAESTSPIPFLAASGYALEYLDLLALHEAEPGILDAYDLVIAANQFEYMSAEMMAQLRSFLDGGGNLFTASHEFACFRVRLDRATQTMTTYKWAYRDEDPYYANGDPALASQVAGVSMVETAQTWETEITGQFMWAAGNGSNGAPVDMPLYHVDEVSWILAGTGLGAGDALPSAFYWYATGNLLAFDTAGQPFLSGTNFTRSSPDTVVWAAAPSSDGRVWFLPKGGALWNWPAFDGWSTATWRQLRSGGEVVSLPSSTTICDRVGFPIYSEIIRNVVGRLGSR